MDFLPLIIFLFIFIIALLIYSNIKDDSYGEKKKDKKTSGKISNTSAFLTDVDTPAKIIRKGKCKYPSRARELGMEALVEVDVHIDKEGEIIETQVVKARGYGFDDAAVKHIRGWKFIPAKNRGKKIDSWIRVPVRFSLEIRNS